MAALHFGTKLIKRFGAFFIILNMQLKRLYHLLSREVPCMAPVIAHLEICKRSLLIMLGLSILSLTTLKRECHQQKVSC